MISRNSPKFKARMGSGFFLLSRFIFTFTYVPACVSVYGCMQLSPVLTEARKGCWVPGARVISGWVRALNCPLQEQQALLSSKLSSQPFLLLHSLWNTLTNVVVDKCEGKTNFFFLRKIHLLTQPQKRECNPSADRQTAETRGQVSRFSRSIAAFRESSEKA